ncbi:MAG: hypothetical protein Q8O89_07360 [Nanoarchaeota archaeon]|nr:hypothetical protein [Nanoarchaeota archaeon]
MTTINEKIAFEQLRKILEPLGIDLSKKEEIMVSRFGKRVRKLGLSSFEEYVTYLSKNEKDEIKNAINVVTTNTTWFFRESEHYNNFRNSLKIRH